MRGEFKNRTYEVGFGKPPERNRFKKGESGNRKGRPKGALNIATILERISRETITINKNGKRKTINKFEAAMTRLADKAAGGDLKALQLWTALMRSAEEHVVQGAVANSVTDEADKKVVLRILERMGTINKEERNKC
jgi:hypothetical protein